MPSTQNCVAGIVAYNTPPELLERTLLSFSNSTRQVQVAVLCNSPDPAYQTNTQALCGRYGCVFIHSSENRGFGASHNQIFQALRPRWYICCNPDTAFPPAMLGILLDSAQDLSDAALIMPLISDSGNPLPPTSRPHLSIASLLRRYFTRSRDTVSVTPIQTRTGPVYPVEFVSGCFFLVSEGVFEQLGGFDPGFFLYCEDADLSFRASALGQNYLVANAVVFHDSARASFKSAKAFYLHTKSMLRYFAKHRPITGKRSPRNSKTANGA